MSFITKRERVFNEYDLFDLPSRNEGKLKAYASCTDARAWSHFCSDKTEHLVEIIKRNNEKCRAKYLPTDVIVNTLMVAKNAEINRLKRNIEDFELMLAAYDQLDLTCEQKCEIANAHATIKAANRELNDMCLDLDLSALTEGIESDGFHTGKSRGDEVSRVKNDWSSGNDLDAETRSNKIDEKCTCEASTFAEDPRIDEMQDALINKDAKLSAMQNTIAVMENDVCEPYCIYAHIYTALEKIFGILFQNEKYKLYLDLLTSGKDTRCLDIKGRILYKLKILEKFCLALIAPCSQGYSPSSDDECACYRAEIIATPDTSFTRTRSDSTKPIADNKRTKLVADIMEHDEMKDIIDKDEISVKLDDDQNADIFGVDSYSIDAENLNRLKNLQADYDELMSCFDAVKHERDILKVRCQKYAEAESELENLRGQLREYNLLWNEKEHYRKRSQDLDSLKEQFLVLSEETSNLETQLKVEAEINSIKVDTIDDLRSDNIALEKKLNEASISFEKENNILQCKLKETECKVMCQEQQIKSLSAQIDRLLEQDKMYNNEHTTDPLVLIDEIESLRDQLKNLKDVLCCNEEEKQQLQEQFEDKLNNINELRMEIEDWKSTYEKLVQRNEYLENAENFQDEVQRLLEENRKLSQDVEEKTRAVGNLMNVINNKSQEVNKFMDEIEMKTRENRELFKQLHDVRESYESKVIDLVSEKKEAMSSLQLARQKSQELLHKTDEMSKSFETQAQDCNELKNVLKNTMDENKKLQLDIARRDNNNCILLHEIQRLREVNNYAIDNINNLQDERNQYKQSLELTRKESDKMENKMAQFEELREKLHSLSESQEKLILEKNKLENELRDKADQLDNALHSIQLSKKESDDLMDKLHHSENVKEDFIKLSGDYNKLLREKELLENDLANKKRDLDNFFQDLNQLRIENEQLLHYAIKNTNLKQELEDLKKVYDELAEEKALLQKDFDNKTEEINILHDTLENKIKENQAIGERIKSLELHQMAAKTSISSLQNENFNTQAALDAVRKESAVLIDKIKHFEALATEFEKLKQAHGQMKLEKERLQGQLGRQWADLKRAEQENQELNSQSQNLITHNEDLEKALINARNELITKLPTQNLYGDVFKEIEDMKKEKLMNREKIRDLLDKLDESENIISNLSEDIMARDDKVAILENHINALEDEVRRLQQNLAEMIDTGEQIKEYSYQKIDQSLNKLEAHHSKATHNMKIELAKLHTENAKLEEQLSVTKIKTVESFRDNHKYVSQVIHLQNEREIIVKDIQQLELGSVGDSALSPENCQVEDVLNSLDRIRKCLDAKNSKGNTLEKTIIKVQTSSQLLLSKADEAQKILEREKQKIVNEKEEAVADRLKMEKQLVELKQQLEKQTNRDKDVIKNLEAEILNQKLIIDKINQSRQKYVSKLEEEMQNLQDMYKNSMDKVSALQDKFNKLSLENGKNLNMIEKINLDLKKKSDEVSLLQQDIKKLKNKSSKNIEIQAGMSIKNRNVSTQTDKEPRFEHDSSDYEEPFQTMTNHVDKEKDLGTRPDLSIINLKIPQQGKNNMVSELIPKQKPQSINEVQILTANVEPTMDFVKNSYLDYKLKRLSVGRLEQYSIPCQDEKDRISQKSDNTTIEPMPQNPHLVDIYNRKSMNTNNSQVDNFEDQTATDHGQRSVAKSSGFTGLTNDIFEFASYENGNKYVDSNMFIASTSDKSAENDLFLIYKDSESNHADKGLDDKEHQKIKRQPEILVETIALHPVKHEKDVIYPKKHFKKTKVEIEPEEDFYHEAEEVYYEDSRLKPILNIELPRVENISSILTISDGDKKSLDSYTREIYSTPKQVAQTSKKHMNKERMRHAVDNKQISDENDVSDMEAPTISKDKRMKHEQKQEEDNIKNIVSPESTKMRKNKDFEKKGSHHKLSRIDANFVLLRSNGPIDTKNDNIPFKMQKPGIFGLNYILDTVQGEVDPDNINGKGLRKSRSDEVMSQIRGTNDSSPSRLNPFKDWSGVTEQSIMVKIDATEEYENQIQNLTKELQNIEKDYKKKIEAIKIQYDRNIKSMINEHNQGVKSIQNLHEETLQDLIKIHENEVENLRSMSIEAMRKAEKLEKENRLLKSKVQGSCSCSGEEHTKMSSLETKKRKIKLRGDPRLLTKTNVEAFNVKPKLRSSGPCTCSLDINISDTIRNIFEQVDVEQRKLAEHAYLKYIANKITSSNVEALDAQELSFLHLKVCRTWKTKLSKEEALQKRIDSLETELLNKQRHAQQHIAELDRKVAEERRRLQEVREAVCRSSPHTSRGGSPNPSTNRQEQPPPPPPPTVANKELLCNCKSGTYVGERRSAGDLLAGLAAAGLKPKRGKAESNRAVLAKLDVEERRERKLYNDEPPTRLRRAHERSIARTKK